VNRWLTILESSSFPPQQELESTKAYLTAVSKKVKKTVKTTQSTSSTPHWAGNIPVTWPEQASGDGDLSDQRTHCAFRLSLWSFR